MSYFDEIQVTIKLHFAAALKNSSCQPKVPAAIMMRSLLDIPRRAPPLDARSSEENPLTFLLGWWSRFFPIVSLAGNLSPSKRWQQTG